MLIALALVLISLGRIPGMTPGAVHGWGNYVTAGRPAGLADAVAVRAAYNYTFVLRSDHTISLWGVNSNGQLDAPAFLLAQRSGGLALWAAVAGRYLYVATTNATDEDHFIFLSRTQSDQMNELGPVWAKAGRVMAFDAFLAGQGATMSNGWFNHAGGAFGNLHHVA